MSEYTVGEAMRVREELEQDAASALGRALLAFSRLDIALGLMVASALRSEGHASRAERVGSMSFKERLDQMQAFGERLATTSGEAANALRDWLSQAERARRIRNQLVHGRWDIDPHNRRALNIVNGPALDVQEVIAYTMEELDAVGGDVKRLTTLLATTRRRWRLP